MKEEKTSNPSVDISLVIPIYNEEEIILKLYERCIEAMKKITENFEIIAVDDGSIDRSLELLLQCHKLDNRFKVLSLSRNFGHQAAFLAGLENSRGETIALIDGDLQDPPELVPLFYEKIKEGRDVVYGIRKKRKENVFKRSVYWLYYRFLAKVSDVPIPHDSGDFCIMRRNVLDSILRVNEHSLFLRGLRSWVGFDQIGIEYERDQRYGGQPKYTLKKLFSLAYNGIFSFSTFPIVLLSRIGLFIVIFSILYIFYILYVRLFTSDIVPGFTTLSIILFFFGGVQMICFGILGEYIIRIYDDTRNRPLYIIKSKTN